MNPNDGAYLVKRDDIAVELNRASGNYLFFVLCGKSEGSSTLMIGTGDKVCEETRLTSSTRGGSSHTGERDAKATAPTQFAFDFNLPSVLLGDALSDGEAQTRPGSKACIFRPTEALENDHRVSPVQRAAPGYYSEDS